MHEDRTCKARLTRDVAGRLAQPRAWIGDGPGAASRELSRTDVAASMIERWSTPPAAGRTLATFAGRTLRRTCCTRCAPPARALLCRRDFFVAAAAGRPSLRRCSGDVVTAGLNSFRVCFGPVPGSP
ncbi:hypothetical protein F511_35306 [Dorcoceras hygrometricum]|uniref:Uncharacterized protein n=1 Tax=Dorcoceras hygrometricum TaxID=472368 RepID=A0A2Z7BSK1_9LAMI|nr:hypothetical protein F511_35306 [Dorcoceras hygrometricum]